MAIQPLFEELLPTETRMISESSSDGKNMWLSGIFMQGNVSNRNGRNYPMNELATAVDTAIQTIKQQNGILGELDHPQTLTINSDRVSHMITELYIKGNDVYGKAIILNTPMGNIAKTIAESGFKWGVSSRGAGNVNESGMVSGFNFVTVDIVPKPSAPNAFPGTLYESLETGIYGRKVLTLAEQLQEDQKAQKYLKKAILEWIEKDIGKLLTK